MWHGARTVRMDSGRLCTLNRNLNCSLSMEVLEIADRDQTECRFKERILASVHSSYLPNGREKEL